MEQNVRDVEMLLSDCCDQSKTMFERAEAMQILCSKYGYTQSKLAKRLGVSQSAVANKIRLLGFCDAEKAQITAYQLTERHARAILRAQPSKRARLISTVQRLNLTVQQTEELVDKFKESNTGDNADAIVEQPLIPNTKHFVDQTIKNAERLRNTGSRVSCLTESGNGWHRITITILD